MNSREKIQLQVIKEQHNHIGVLINVIDQLDKKIKELDKNYDDVVNRLDNYINDEQFSNKDK